MLEEGKNTASRTALKWAVTLFVAGAAFIGLSDLILDRQLNDYTFYRTYQTYKGIAFFAVIAVFFYLISRRLLRRIHQDERALRRERQFSEQTQNSIPGIFFVLDPDRRLVRWNKSTPSVTGRSDDELMNLPAIELVEESWKEKGREALDQVFREGSAETELLLDTRDEKDRLFKITANRFQNDGHYFIVGTGIDVTEENRVRNKLAKVLARERRRREEIEVDIKNLKETLDQTPSPRCILEGPNHVYSYANEAYKKLVGTEALEGKKLTDIIPEVEEQGYISILDQVYRTGKSYSASNQSVTIGQEEYIFNLVYEPLRDGDGEIYGLYCEGIEVSDQIRANEKIKRQNYQLKTAQEIARLGYWESNLETDELTWADIIYDLFGLDKETFEATRDNFFALIPPADRAGMPLDPDRLKRESTFEWEYRLIKPGGEVGWFREVGEVYEWDGDQPRILHGIVQDITDQKNQEKELRKSHIEGENKERKRISNELHDGIAQYLSAAQLHLDNAADLTDGEKEGAQLHHARQLVRQALTETRTISQNLMPQTIEKHGLTTAIQSLIKQYHLSSDITFSFRKNLDPPVSFCKEIETNVYRIIQELLSNAVRHSDCSQIWISLVKEREQLVCTIRDDGKGAPTQTLAGSTGLGLQSVRDRVDLLSGSITFNSSGDGLDITITIPLNKPHYSSYG